MNDTRIKRYSKLREQIYQEIKMIELKQENNKKVNLYRKSLMRIDPHLFDKVNVKTNDYFPNFNSLIQIEQKTKKEEWEKDKEDIYKWIEVIDGMLINENDVKSLDDFVPKLSNEKFVENRIKIWKNNKTTNEQQFAKMMDLKKKFFKDTDLKKESLGSFNILDKTNIVYEKIQDYNQKLETLTNRKKQKTKWFFWVKLFFFIGLITCLIIILLT